MGLYDKEPESLRTSLRTRAISGFETIQKFKLTSGWQYLTGAMCLYALFRLVTDILWAINIRVEFNLKYWILFQSFLVVCLFAHLTYGRSKASLLAITLISIGQLIGWGAAGTKTSTIKSVPTAFLAQPEGFMYIPDLYFLPLEVMNLVKFPESTLPQRAALIINYLCMLGICWMVYRSKHRKR